MTNFEFSSTIIGKVSDLSGGFSGRAAGGRPGNVWPCAHGPSRAASSMQGLAQRVLVRARAAGRAVALTRALRARPPEVPEKAALQPRAQRA